MKIEYIIVEQTCSECRKVPPSSACCAFEVIEPVDSYWATQSGIPLGSILDRIPAYKYRIGAFDTMPKVEIGSLLVAVYERSISILTDGAICEAWQERIKRRLYDKGVRFLLISPITEETAHE